MAWFLTVIMYHRSVLQPVPLLWRVNTPSNLVSLKCSCFCCNYNYFLTHWHSLTHSLIHSLTYLITSSRALLTKSFRKAWSSMPSLISLLFSPVSPRLRSSRSTLVWVTMLLFSKEHFWSSFFIVTSAMTRLRWSSLTYCFMTLGVCESDYDSASDNGDWTKRVTTLMYPSQLSRGRKCCCRK